MALLLWTRFSGTFVSITDSLGKWRVSPAGQRAALFAATLWGLLAGSRGGFVFPKLRVP